MEKEQTGQQSNFQLKADMEGNYLIDKEYKPEKQVGIFYAPSGGSVHKVCDTGPEYLGNGTEGPLVCFYS